MRTGDGRLHGRRQLDRAALDKFVVFALSALATIHVVWFYIIRVPSLLDLDLYERGLERMPFQGRLLMSYPLRWAHGSAALGHAAAWLTSLHMWLPRAVVPEDIVELAVDVIAVAVAGFVARELYRSRSTKARLLAYVYPVFLVMVAGSYCLVSTHFFRYVYDLPSLGLFACGLYLIYRREQPALFAIVFVVATINRETSLLLLFLFVGQRCFVDRRFVWKRLFSFAVGGTTAALAAFWLGWHMWLTRHFGGLASDVQPGVLANLMAVFWPLTWPQLAGVGAYTLPVLLLFRGKRTDDGAWLWMWILPLWAAMMLFYGSIIEIRLFGELIPLFACTAVLVAEERLFGEQ